MREWPWWMWGVITIVVVLCLIASAALGYRQSGLRALRKEIANVQSQGRPALPADLLAQFRKTRPMIDVTRQERLWKLVCDPGRRVVEMPPTGGMDGRFGTLEKNDEIAAKSQAFLDETATDRTEWAAMSSDGPLCISLLGWLGHDIPDVTRMGLREALELRVPKLGRTRRLAMALATEARLSANPIPALNRLDLLVAAASFPGCINDSMMYLTIANVRDSAWLEASLRRIDPAPWQDHLPSTIELMATALTSERCLQAGSFAQSALRGEFIPAFGTNWQYRLRSYIGTSYDAAFLYRISLAGEDFARTGIDTWSPYQAQFNDEFFIKLHPITCDIVGNSSATVTNGVIGEVSSRRYRAAGTLAYAWLASGVLPETTDDVDRITVGLLHATTRTPAITYTKLSPTRFRLAIDPSTVSPDMIPRAQIDVPIPFTGDWKGGECWLELDLRSIQRP